LTGYNSFFTILTQMRSGDERADNLLSRLFSYSPRPGRQPLEDYCTEALAWCLRSSPDLRTKFLSLARLERLSTRVDRPAIHTQVGFKTTDEENDDNETGGRFDLVIEFGLPEPFVLVVETKVGSPLGRNQLQTYRNELARSDAFEGTPQDARYLVTLTTMRYPSPLTHASVTWPEVHHAVFQSQSSESKVLVDGVLYQFALFLKEKGLSMLELKKTSATLLGQWRGAKELEEQLKQIVERLRNQEEIKPIVGRRQVTSDDVWTGVYETNDFFAGFGILNMEGGPELFMQVEIKVPGDQRKLVKGFDAETRAAFENAKRYQAHFPVDLVNFGKTTVDGNSWFVFTKQVVGELDGDGEAVFQWLYRTAKRVVALLEHAKPTK
jgi:hypothetical protein